MGLQWLSLSCPGVLVFLVVVAMAWVEVPVIQVSSDSEQEQVIDLLTQVSSDEVIDLSTQPAGSVGPAVAQEGAAETSSAVLTAEPLIREAPVPLRQTRWGRCSDCSRALRPWVSLRGDAYLICPRIKVGPHHSRVPLSQAQVVSMGVPLRLSRRARVSF